MKPPKGHCKCLNCREFFLPDFRNRTRQKYCAQPACQRASKRASQQRWLSQPANAHYFRDEQNRKRVRDWRQLHPQYWKRSPKKPAVALQDSCLLQPAIVQEVTKVNPPLALQDLWSLQLPLKRGQPIVWFVLPRPLVHFSDLRYFHVPKSFPLPRVIMGNRGFCVGFHPAMQLRISAF